LSSIKRTIISARGFAMPYADVFYFLFLAFLMWSKSTYVEKTADLNLFFILSACFLAIKYALTDWKLNDIWRAAALIWLGAVTFVTSGHSILLVTCAGIAGAKGINFKNVLSSCLVLRIALYIFVVAFANMNVIPLVNYSTYKTVDGVLTVVNRYALGFTMPNAAHILFLVTATLYIAVHYKKFNVLHAAVITAINIILYNLTNCRTGFAMLIIIVVVALLFKIDRVYKVLGRFVPYLAPVCALVCFCFSAMYGKVGFVDNLNTILSNRFSYSQLFINAFGLSVFGQNTSSLVSGSVVMDVAYVNLAVNYGVIPFIAFMVMCTALAYKSVRAGDRGLAVAFMAMALLGSVENYTLDIGINFTLILASSLIFRSEQKGAALWEGAHGLNTK